MRTTAFRISVAPRTAVASAVDPARIGQEVYVSSGMLGMAGGCSAEARAVPEDRLRPLPRGLSFEAAATLSYHALAAAMLSECGCAQHIRWVLLSGASGGMGTALVHMAKTAGHRVLLPARAARRAHLPAAVDAAQDAALMIARRGMADHHARRSGDVETIPQAPGAVIVTGGPAQRRWSW